MARKVAPSRGDADGLDGVLRAAKGVAHCIEWLQYRCQPTCGSNRFEHFWPAVADWGERLRLSLESLGQSLAIPEVRDALREATDDAAEVGGEAAASYAEAVFAAGERLYLHLQMLSGHGVLYLYNARDASSLPFDKPFPVLPAADAIQFEKGHGGCLRSPEWLVGRVCDVVAEIPAVRGKNVAAYLVKEIDRARLNQRKRAEQAKGKGGRHAKEQRNERIIELLLEGAGNNAICETLIDEGFPPSDCTTEAVKGVIKRYRAGAS